MTTLALIVDWYGPFSSIEEASEVASEFELGECLYIAYGKLKKQRSASIQYVGITKNPARRLVDHHKISLIQSDLKVWWGEVASQSVAGRKGNKKPVRHSVMLTTAERTLAYFMALPLNEKLRKTTPKQSVVLSNRWFNGDGIRRYHRADAKWPDMIEFDMEGEDLMALRLWFGSPGKRDRLSAADIRALADT